MKLITLLLAFLSLNCFGVAQVSIVPTDLAEYSLNRNQGPAAYKYSAGSLLKQAHNTAVGTYDFSLTGGAIGQHDIGIHLPSKAIVRNVMLDVVTTLVGTGAFVSLDMQSQADLYPLTAIASVTTRKLGIPDFATITDAIKLTAARNVYFVVATAALTAGKVKVFVDYVVSE